jgi:hypothetical protein
MIEVSKRSFQLEELGKYDPQSDDPGGFEEHDLRGD